MGSAVIKQRSAEKLMQEPIDLDTFSDLAKEYEKLKNVGLTVEEIHKLLNFRLHSALNSANVESKQENAGKLAAEDEVREARLALPPVKTENASAIKVATLDKKEVESTGTVLLVDDSVVAMKVSAKILTSLNFEVVMCYSAQDGYDKLIESPHKFSLVLLDIVMPKIDGVELLSWIKDKPEIAHVKVYMLSGLEDQTLADVCMERGAEGMLLKPLIPEVIKKIFQMQSFSQATKRPSRTSIIKVADAVEKVNNTAIQIGRQAPAFILFDTEFGEYKYPLSNERNSLLIAFTPTLFLAELHFENGMIHLLKNEYSEMIAKKINVVVITSDIFFAAAEAKNMFDIPFSILCDPLLTVCSRYVGISDFGEYLANPNNNNPKISSACSRNGSNLAMVLLDKHRNVLKNWCAVTVDGKLNARLAPPSPLEWIRNFHNKKKSVDIMQSDDMNMSVKDRGVVQTDELQQKTIIDTSILIHGKQQEPAGITKASSKKIILIVDDSSISSKLAAKKIESLGYSTEIAYNGQTAHDMLKANPRKYCLVLLDICMPVCDGMELLKIMKSNDILKYLPVIMLSSLEGNDVTESFKQQGALEVMKKPFDESVFLAALVKARVSNNV